MRPLPRVDDILDLLGDAQYFSTLDLLAKAPTGKFMLTKKIATRLLLLPSVVCLNLTGCLSALLMRQQHFKEPWILCLVASLK